MVFLQGKMATLPAFCVFPSALTKNSAAVFFGLIQVAGGRLLLLLGFCVRRLQDAASGGDLTSKTLDKINYHGFSKGPMLFGGFKYSSWLPKSIPLGPLVCCF